MKKIPLAKDNFKELIEANCYYVDKTLLIKELIDSESKIILLTRPRRFGKTLNLSMLKCFFEIPEGRTIEETQGLEKAIDYAYLFKDFEIEKDTVAMKLQGKSPVIHFSFKKVKAQTFKDASAWLKEEISREYKRHSYILDKIKLSKGDILRYNEIMDETADLSDYSSAIHNLCIYLYTYYQKLAYVFIDEYDTPLHYAKLNGYYDEMLNIIRALMVDGMKDNNAMKQAVITGIMKIAGESIFSAFNNPKIATISDRFAQDKFGFLENEVLELLKYHNLEKVFDDVKHWYNGYRFGDIEIYNQWSILSFVDNNGIYAPYWSNTGDPSLIRRIMQLDTTYSKKTIEKLLDGEYKEVEIETNIVYDNIFHNIKKVYSFLYHSGYLKAKWIKDNTYYVQIPNYELKTIYLNILNDWLSEDMLKGSTSLNDLIDGMLKNDEALFNLKLKTIMLTNVSYYDTIEREKKNGPIYSEEDKSLTKYENFYHGLFIGMMLQLSDDYYVESNKEYGLGRPDITVIPKDPTKQGFIIELKRNARREDKSVETLADEALKQIDEMKYLDGINKKATKWLKIGIGYKGKDCEAFFQ